MRRTTHWSGSLFLPVIASCIFDTLPAAQTRPDTDWPYYGGDAGGMRYSRLTQVNPENVSKLKVAWVFHTGDVSDGKHGKQRSGFETTPILVDGILVLTTGFNRVIAVNPRTGRLQWAYDPKIDPTWDYGDALVNRGVATWLDPARNAKPPLQCRRRIYEATLDARLIALDSATGVPCADFGDKGEVSRRDVPRYRAGQYHMTSPPAVVDDLVVVGSAINDNNRVDMPSGVVGAFKHGFQRRAVPNDLVKSALSPPRFCRSFADIIHWRPPWRTFGDGSRLRRRVEKRSALIGS
jgi:quinoprotein glucose dehydrogenase